MMQNWILYACLQQLSRFYACSQLQYINAAICAPTPILRRFLEERAFERLDFISDLEVAMEGGDRENRVGPLMEEVFQRHLNLYGQNSLTMSEDGDFMDTDFKIIEICNLLLSHDLLPSFRRLLRYHLLKVESARLSMYYLKTLYP